MERFDVSEGDRFAEMVNAAERGEVVEITREGRTVAQMEGVPERTSAKRSRSSFDPAAWDDLHRHMPPELLGGDATAELRSFRDQE